MKSKEESILNYIFIIFFIVIIFGVITRSFEDEVLILGNIRMKHLRLIVGLMFMISIIILGYTFILMELKNGLYNIRKCDDELFQNIDFYIECYRRDNSNYLKQIQIINLYYSDGGKVDELVQEKKLERLFMRRDFLLKKIHFSDNIIEYYCSLGISILASYIFTANASNNLLNNIILVLLILGSFVGFIILRYAKRGQAGSCEYQIQEYELTLLNEKIEKLEKNSIITPDDEKLLLTKQIVLNELIKKRKKAKRKGTKETLEKDIKIVENLELCMGDYSDFFLQNIYLGEKEIYLVYNKEKGKTKKCTGEKYLATQDYAILYNILKKYDWISYE